LPKTFCCNFGMNFKMNQEGGVRVTEIMKTDFGKASFFNEIIKML